MEPHQRIRYTFFTLYRNLLISIGHNYLQKGGFKPNLYSFFLYMLNALGFTSCIYTIIWYDVATGLNSIGYGAINVQLVARILLMRYAQLMTKTINNIVDVYETNAQTKLRQRALLLRNMSWLSELILIGGTIIYILGAILHYLNPIYGYFWQHEYKALFPLYIPFVDEKTASGFAILITIQTIELSVSILSSATADFPFAIIVINVWIFTTIFEDHMNELNGILRRKKKVRMPLATAKLRSIFEMYQQIWVLIDDINTIFFLNDFIVIFSAAVAAAVEFFTCMKIGLIPASYLAGLFIIQICGSCAFGTIIELCVRFENEQMTNSLFQCDWYLLPTAEQMKFKFLVMHVDVGKHLTLGGIRPLNMELCVSILKTIYSYVMVLHKMIE